MAMTLNARLRENREKVALPDADDWALLGSRKDTDPVVSELNQVLISSLDVTKDTYISFQLFRHVYSRVTAISRRHPSMGVMDSEALGTIALFIALNVHPCMYDMFRYPDVTSLS